MGYGGIATRQLASRGDNFEWACLARRVVRRMNGWMNGWMRDEGGLFMMIIIIMIGHFNISKLLHLFAVAPCKLGGVP